jgi:hypothetical protein
VTSGATDVGEYTVRATFANNNPNYETIPDMEATLKITPAEYTLKGVDLVFKNGDSKVINGTSKIYDGTGVSFDLNDYSKLSNKVSASFFVLDKDGNVISTSNKNTDSQNAGVYTVKVEFTLADSKNYKPVEPIVCEFEVKKATYDIADIHFDNDVVAYDGEAHKLLVELPLNHVIAASDITYEYYLDGVLVVDGEGKPVQSVTEAGEYTVKAIFAVKDDNYEQIEAKEAVLRIEQ